VCPEYAFLMELNTVGHISHFVQEKEGEELSLEIMID
jgi:hypothetical protein